MPGPVTLQSLTASARSLADQLVPGYISVAECTDFINRAYFKVYDLMVDTYGEDYFVAPAVQFQSTALTDTYALPNGTNFAGAPAFYKLLGIDMALPGVPATPDNWVTCYRFNFQERNRGSIIPFFNNINRPIDFKYRMKGDANGNPQLWLRPVPILTTTWQIWYVPLPTPLVNPTDLTINLQNGWDDVIAMEAAARMKIKGEEDPSALNDRIAAETKRLQDAAANRDIATPSTIVDAYAPGNALGTSYGGGFYGDV